MPPASLKPILLICLSLAVIIGCTVFILLSRPAKPETQLPGIDFTEFPDLDFESARPADDETSPYIAFPGDL